MALIGYARVSTDAQDTLLQRMALEKAGCEQIFEETASGSKANRSELKRCLDYLREGDVLVMWKLDRLARSLKQLVDIIHDLGERGIGFRCLTQSIDTTSASGKLVFGIFATLAEFERDLIKERTIAGLNAARAEGRIGGRPLKLSEDQIAELEQRLAGKQPWRSVAADMGISQATISRYRNGERDASRKRRAQAVARAAPSNNKRKTKRSIRPAAKQRTSV